MPEVQVITTFKQVNQRENPINTND